MKLNLNVGHRIGKFFAACFQISQTRKRQQRLIASACGAFSTTETLEDRNMMTADPVGAIVAPESDHIVSDYMLQDIAEQSTTNDDLFAALAAEPLSAKEIRQQERAERHAEQDMDIRGAKKIRPDKSGVHASVSPVGDGVIESGTEDFIKERLSASRSKYLVAGSTLNIEGDISGIVSATVSVDGVPLQTVIVTGHQVNFEGYAVGPIGKRFGEEMLTFSFTVAQGVEYHEVNVFISSNAYRRWNGGIKFNSNVPQNKTTVGIGNDDGGHHGTNPGIEMVATDGSTIVSENGMITDKVRVRLTSQPTGNLTVTINGNGPFTANPTTLTFTPSNWDEFQDVALVGMQDPNNTTDTGSVVATSIYDNESLPVIVTDDDTGGGDEERQFDSAQFYFKYEVRLISVSGFHPVLANEFMTLRLDTNRDGDANEEYGHSVADSNGGYIVSTDDPTGVRMPADTHGIVTYFDPASQGFTHINGVTIIYEDDQGVHNVNASSSNVQVVGETLVISRL